jgi:hypothetical protein
MTPQKVFRTIVLSAVGLALGATGLAPAGTASAATVASLATVQVNPTETVGGTPATGTVTLTSAAASGGFVVALSSDNPAVATVPASVTVPAGASSATFPVATTPVSNSQSALIIGTAQGFTTYAILTVRTESSFSQGSVAIIPGGNGNGIVTSQPAGIDCRITGGSGAGTCSAFFPVGTVVRLTAKAGAGSKFQGWRGLPGCGDPSRITVARGTTIYCQPGFVLR